MNQQLEKLFSYKICNLYYSMYNGYFIKLYILPLTYIYELKDLKIKTMMLFYYDLYPSVSFICTAKLFLALYFGFNIMYVIL